jgi:hypothetical protein
MTVAPGSRRHREAPGGPRAADGHAAGVPGGGPQSGTCRAHCEGHYCCHPARHPGLHDTPPSERLSTGERRFGDLYPPGWRRDDDLADDRARRDARARQLARMSRSRLIEFRQGQLADAGVQLLVGGPGDMSRDEFMIAILRRECHPRGGPLRSAGVPLAGRPALRLLRPGNHVTGRAAGSSRWAARLGCRACLRFVRPPRVGQGLPRPGESGRGEGNDCAAAKARGKSAGRAGQPPCAPAGSAP